ncbi:hypothetical protein TWF696_006504 [Orbilia brochopaga]|uniref:Uncharacterized protein n=1 Tax=Orbilia brochopaga TaxID=3140254 RepID=A0AAV9UYW1_9PEZI
MSAPDAPPPSPASGASTAIDNLTELMANAEIQDEELHTPGPIRRTPQHRVPHPSPFMTREQFLAEMQGPWPQETLQRLSDASRRAQALLFHHRDDPDPLAEDEEVRIDIPGQWPHMQMPQLWAATRRAYDLISHNMRHPLAGNDRENEDPNSRGTQAG